MMTRLQKIVLHLAIRSEKSKRRAVRTIAGIEGVESIAVVKKERKIIVIGDVDPVCLITQLRKFFCTRLLSVGPAKEEKIVWA